MFMELVYSSRHFQCLALILSYINPALWGRPRCLYIYFGWSADLSIEGGINLDLYLGISVLKVGVNIKGGGGER